MRELIREPRVRVDDVATAYLDLGRRERALLGLFGELARVLVEPIDLRGQPVENLAVGTFRARVLLHDPNFGPPRRHVSGSVRSAHHIGSNDSRERRRQGLSHSPGCERPRQYAREMDQPPVTVIVRERVAHVQLTNPGRRNALSRSVLDVLFSTFVTLGEDTDVGVIVLSATGPAFSAGHDIGEMVGRDEQYYRELFGACSSLMQLLRRMPQPVIAAVDGLATAAGCQLVAGCDLAVATETSTFATPGVRVGLFCSTPLVPISRAIGQKRVMQMLLTGRPIDAATALAWGLVNCVVPRADLDAAVDELAHEILEWSSTVVGLGKSAYYHQMGLSEPSAYEVMTEIMTANALLPDAQEGLRAFTEKRAAVWPTD